MLIYPYFISESEIGQIKFISETALFMIPFVTLGINAVSVRFYPRYMNENTGFLSFLFLVATAGYILMLGILFLFKNPIVDYVEAKSEYLYVIIPLIFLLSYAKILNNYCISLQRIAIPNLINNILPKIGVPILILIYTYWLHDEGVLYYGLGGIYFLVVILMLIYVYQLGALKLNLNFKFLDKETIREMSVYSFYGILGRMSTIVATRLDIVMLGSLSDFRTTGIYTIALLISSVIGIPQESINNIAAGVMSLDYEKGNTENIKKVYYDSCLNQFVAALFIFIGIWCSLDYLFDIMPKGDAFRAGKSVVLLLGIAKIIDAVTGANNSVIGYSKYFRFNFYAILILAVFNILFNIIFISYFGMIGAAISTCLSIAIYNLSKYIFILIKFKLQPFNMKMVYALFIGLFTYFIATIIPVTGNPYLDIILTSVIIAIIYPSLVIYFKVSTDINSVFNQLKSKVLK